MLSKKCEPVQEETTFTSEQIAHAFGVSRSKILRVEDAGLIYPKERSGRANSRHYDAGTVLKLEKNFHYHDLGYTIDDTIRYFNGEGDYQEIIRDVENRIHELTNVLTSLKNRTDATQHMVVQTTTSVASYYYCEKVEFPHSADKALEIMKNVISSAIRRGYTLRYELPITLTGLSFSAIEKDISHRPYLCVPITNEAQGDHILYLPREERQCVHWIDASSNRYFLTEYLQILKEIDADYDDETLFRCDLLSYPLNPKLPKNDSWVVRFYLP